MMRSRPEQNTRLHQHGCLEKDNVLRTNRDTPEAQCVVEPRLGSRS